MNELMHLLGSLVGALSLAIVVGAVVCVFLRWFLGINQLQKQLEEVLQELRELKQRKDSDSPGA